MPILVSPYDYPDSSYSPQQPSSTELSKALGELSFGAEAIAAASTSTTATTEAPAASAEPSLATADFDRDMTAWRELWDLPNPSNDNQLAPALDRGFSNSVASELDSLPELASDCKFSTPFRFLRAYIHMRAAM
jgi:hypothetical protein